MKVILGLSVVATLLALYSLSRYQPPDNISLNLPNYTDIQNDLAKEEQMPLKPDNQKRILWSSQVGKKTPNVIVFIHGFSASPKELSPFPEMLGQKLGANIYFARLNGHGHLSAEKLAEASVKEWLKDAKVALSWGLHLGERIVLVANSTGAPLALWLAKNYPDKLEALVLLSPNFGPKNQMANLLLHPGAEFLARLFIGDYREWKPLDEEQHKFWHTRYPSKALIPMMRIVDLGRKIDFAEIKVPTLLVYSEKDEVLDVNIMKRKFKHLGAKIKKLWHLESAQGHILAGLGSPGSTSELLSICHRFLKPLVMH